MGSIFFWSRNILTSRIHVLKSSIRVWYGFSAYQKFTVGMCVYYLFPYFNKKLTYEGLESYSYNVETFILFKHISNALGIDMNTCSGKYLRALERGNLLNFNGLIGS